MQIFTKTLMYTIKHIGLDVIVPKKHVQITIKH